MLLALNMVVLIVFQVIRGGASYDALYGWVGNLAMLVPTVACFACAWLGGPRRAAAIWLGLAMLSQTAGNVIFSTWTQFQTDPPVPSPADFAYLGFYVVRRRRDRLPRAAATTGPSRGRCGSTGRSAPPAPRPRWPRR